jgi:hypothetical protein
VKRTIIFLLDELHERLRQDAFRSHVSMAELIRRWLGRGSRFRLRRTLKTDPLLEAAGRCCGPLLSGNMDGELYGF